MSFCWGEAGIGLITLKAPIQSGHGGILHPTDALPLCEGEAGVLDKAAEGHDLGPTRQRDRLCGHPADAPGSNGAGILGLARRVFVHHGDRLDIGLAQVEGKRHPLASFPAGMSVADDMIVTAKGLSKMLQTLSVTRLQTRGRHNGACCLSALQI